MAGNESLGRSEQMWKVLKRSVKNSLVYGGSKTLLLVAAAAGAGTRLSRTNPDSSIQYTPDDVWCVFLRPMGQGPK